MNTNNIITLANEFKRGFEDVEAYQNFRINLINETKRQYIDMYYWLNQKEVNIDYYRESMEKVIEEIEDFFLGDMFDFCTIDLNLEGERILDMIKDVAEAALYKPYRRTFASVTKEYELEKNLIIEKHAKAMYEPDLQQISTILLEYEEKATFVRVAS